MTILDQPYTTTTQPLVYASFIERVLARLIDLAIVIIPSLFVPILFPWLYYALQESSSSGATIGKRALGLRVVSVQGRQIDFGTATGRFFANFLNLFTMFIGYLLMFFNAQNQCLHDMITGTVVVKDYPITFQPTQTPQRSQQQKRSWSNKVGTSDTHFVEITPTGGRHWHRSPAGEVINGFTLWQLTDGLVDFSGEFSPEDIEAMKQYAEHLLRSKA